MYLAAPDQAQCISTMYKLNDKAWKVPYTSFELLDSIKHGKIRNKAVGHSSLFTLQNEQPRLIIHDYGLPVWTCPGPVGKLTTM